MSLTAAQDGLARPAEADDGAPPGLRRFLVPAFSQLRSRLPADPALSWIVTAVITGMAALIRLWGIGFPDRATYGYVFDETYYAPEARELLNNGGAGENTARVCLAPPAPRRRVLAAAPRPVPRPPARGVAEPQPG